MFKVLLDDARVFKNSVDAIVTLIDEGEFDFGEKGLSLRAMDPSQIAMVDFSLPKKAFKKYDLDKSVKIGLSLEDLAKVLGRVRAGESLDMSIQDSRLSMEFSGKTKRSFTLPLLNLGGSVPNEPKIAFDGHVVLNANEIREALKDASLVSAHVSISLDKDVFRIFAKGEKGEVNIETKKSDDCVAEYKVGEKCSAMFPLEYLNDLLKAADSGAVVSIYLKSDAPLKVEYGIGDASVVYYLAPRIESQ